MKGYYFITDAALSKAGNVSDVTRAIDAGVKIVQYRNKSNITAEMYAEAMAIKDLCARSAVTLIINDRIDIALAVDADGVHIGQDDMPYAVARRLLGGSKIIGVTVHNLDEATDAVGMGADYLGVSPIFATGTKDDAGRPCGVGLVEDVRRAYDVPIAAIGGITLENADGVIAAGADMLCAISAVVTATDVAEEIRKFQRKYTLS